MLVIYNREKLKSNRDKVTNNIANCLFFKHAAEDIMERLNIINKKFFNILDLGCRTGHLTKLLVQTYNYATITATDSSDNLLSSFEHNCKLLIDEEDLQFEPASFDLITFSSGLHWINDVQNFLSRIKLFLKPDGIFIGNFIGGNSLKELSKQFVKAEIATNRPHYRHISPFINFNHLTPLLSQAGFIEIIVDHHQFQLDYKSPLDFMKELKNIGESGALIKNSVYSISKQMFAILSDNTNIFTEQITIINFIASPSKNIMILNHN